MSFSTPPKLASLAVSHGWVFPLLTLDRAAAFYDMMGLRIGAPGSTLQDVIRRETVAVRKRVMPSGDTRTLADAKLLDFFDAIEVSIGSAGTQRLIWWLTGVLHGGPRSHLDLSHWDYVLRYCRHADERWDKVGFPTALSLESKKRFMASIDVSSFRKLSEEVDSRPLSDWDLHMYASQLYDFDNDPQGPSLRPFSVFLATVRNFQGYCFWNWVLKTLAASDLDRLFERAVKLVQDDELRSAANLPHPAVLNIRL